MLKRLLIPFVAGLFSLNALAAGSQPNVLVIYTDDQGSIDANCYGATDLITPTMDKLAATGTRFTQMLAPSAICSASRAGLLSGRTPWRVGVPGNVSSQHGKRGLEPAVHTLAELFRDHGYRTHHVGKWHLGYTDDTMPLGHGFDTSFGHMGGCIDNYSHFFYWNGPNRHDLWRNGKEVWEDGKNFGRLMVGEMKDVIDRRDKKPFFIYWAINWPHYPLQGFDKWRVHYRHLDSPRDKYAAFVSSMDELMGEILSHLEKRGLRKDTIVVFQSDHGHSIEERTFFGGGNPGPYRGHKGSFFEGGLRVPSIVSWPGHLPEGHVRDQFVTGCDWYPTLAELAGLDLPEGHHLDGKSIVPIIQSSEAASPHEHFFWSFGRRRNNPWAIRQGDWKLLGNPRDDRNKGSLGKDDTLFLVNLANDIGETTNLAAQHPDKVKELQSIYNAWTTSIQSDVENLKSEAR